MILWGAAADRLGRWRAYVVVVVLAIVAAVLPAHPAAAADIWSCTDAGGVWVIVQGSGLNTAGCAHSPSDGEAALRDIGVTPRHAQSGIICSLSGHPADCPAKPPFGAYWSYWHAWQNPQGAAFTPWEYSQLGAISYKPKAGSVELWWFGDGMGGGKAQPPVGLPTRQQVAPAPAGQTAPVQPAAPRQQGATDSSGTTAAGSDAATDPSDETAASGSAPSSGSPSSSPASAASSANSSALSPSASPSSAAASFNGITWSTGSQGHSGSGPWAWIGIGVVVVGTGGYLGWRRWRLRKP